MPSNDYHRYVSKKQRAGKMKRIILEVSISIILILLGIGLSFPAKPFIRKRIFDAVNLIPSSEAFDNWIKPPITTTRSYYLFNITNPYEIMIDPSSTMIQLKDSPGYTYNLETQKKNAQWSTDKKSISYEVERLFTRHETQFKSSSVNDTGVFVNLLRATLRTKFGVKSTPAFYSLAGNNAFNHTNAVEQLEGFTSDLFATVKSEMYGPNLEKSGYLYRQNGSRLYNISIHTDVQKKGQVITFDSELVPFSIVAPSVYSFPIYDGLTFPSNLSDKPVLNIFNSDFCKPVMIKFNKTVVSPQGINLYEYKLKLIDYNDCTNLSDAETCREVDQIDVSSCISKSLPNNTIFLSKPHFYGANDERIEEMNIEGFTPNTDKHDSFVRFEPNTGTPFEAIFRLQLNVKAVIDPMRYSDDGSEGLEPAKKKGVPRLLPVFWIDQEVRLAPKVVNKLGRAFFCLKYASYLIAALVSVLIILSIILIEVIAKRSARNMGYTRGTYLQTGTTDQY